MPAVPSATNSVADFPIFLVWPDGYDMTDDFVAWNPRAVTHQYHHRKTSYSVLQWSPKHGLLDDDLGMANATSLDLDEDLAFLGLLGLNLFDDKGTTLLFKHGRLVRFGDVSSHAD